MLSLHALTLDEELQPRAAIDRTVLENYMQLLVDGVQFPPVVAFRDGDILWLSDGFHRWHSRKALDLDDIEADIREGTRRDALLYSLSANAKHGLQRGPTDYRRAYEIACRHGLVDPVDSEAVAALLRCSGRWATDLTARAREAARAQREAEIIRLKDQGRTNRDIAHALGLKSPQTVTDVQKRHSAGIGQDPSLYELRPHPDPVATPFLSERAKENLRELESPEALAWSSALRALRHINEQISVDELYDLRFVGFDHVVETELAKAFEWINELHGRFVNERHNRRRA